jgi:GGDEF domain-containing protein
VSEFKQPKKIFNFLKSPEEKKMSGNILEKNFNPQIVIQQLIDVVNHEEKTSNLWHKAYDTGALKSHKFANPLSKISPETFNPIIEEKPAIIFNRPAFTKKLLEKILDSDGKYNGTPFKLLLADIKGLEAANRIEDEFGNKAADVMINSVVRSIASTLKHIDTKNIETPGFGRYGGDEFAISLIGQGCEAVGKELESLIPENLAKEQGMYAGNDKNDGIYFRPIELKKDAQNNELQTITPPENPMELEIYIHFLKRSLILDSNQVSKVLTKFEHSEHDSISQYLSSKYPNSFYPDHIKTDEEKISYIRLHNEDLADELVQAKIHDNSMLRQHKASHTFKSKLDFIENVVFDPLLKGIILQFPELYDNLSDMQYSHIMMLDVKFIKEINDDENKGYVDSDMLIIQLYDKIKKVLTPKELKHIDIGRRGGSFFMCIKRGDMDPESIQKIENKLVDIQEVVAFEGEEDEVKIPIGFGSQKINVIQEESKYQRHIRAKLDELFDQSDETWYNKIFLAMVNSNSNDELRSLINQFFTGKRQVQRAEKALFILESEYMLSQNQKKHLEGEFKSLLLTQNRKDEVV